MGALLPRETGHGCGQQGASERITCLELRALLR